jgi:hypothetical protein
MDRAFELLVIKYPDVDMGCILEFVEIYWQNLADDEENIASFSDFLEEEDNFNNE